MVYSGNSDKKERMWIWMYDENLDFLYEKGAKIRFEVESAHFQKTGFLYYGSFIY